MLRMNLLKSTEEDKESGDPKPSDIEDSQVANLKKRRIVEKVLLNQKNQIPKTKMMPPNLTMMVKKLIHLKRIQKPKLLQILTHNNL